MTPGDLLEDVLALLYATGDRKPAGSGTDKNTCPTCGAALENDEETGEERCPECGRRDVVMRELENAPEFVRNLVSTLPDSYIERVYSDKESFELRDSYVEAKILGPKWLDDMTQLDVQVFNLLQEMT